MRIGNDQTLQRKENEDIFSCNFVLPLYTECVQIFTTLCSEFLIKIQRKLPVSTMCVHPSEYWIFQIKNQ
jgi:hypothetical protein